MFGASNTNTSGGLFGSSNSNTNTTGGGLFGAAKPAASTGFGTTNNTTATSTGGGLFGSQQGQQQQQPATGGLFGAKPAVSTTTTGGGLFGQANNTQTGSTGGGLFGNQQQQQQPATGGLFGAKPAASTTGGGLFGGNTGSTTSGGLFGAKPATTTGATTTGGLFGGNTGTTTTTNTGASTTFQNNNSNNTLNQQQNQATTNLNTYTPAVNDQLNKIWEQWDPNSGKNVLKSYLYNKFTDDEIKILLNQPRPNNITSEDWEIAMNKRPGPNYYPIPINSFNEIATRIETQLDHVSKSRVLLNNINTNLDNLSSQHDLENTTRILKAKLNHEKLSRRLLRLATVLSIIKLKGYPLLPEEEEISKQFDLLSNKLNDPNGSIGKLNDLFARLSILKERAEDLNTQFDNSINLLSNEDLGDKASSSSTSSTSVTTTNGANAKNNSDEVINKISQILLKQQMGLNYLNDVLEKDKSKLK
ncbi:Nucleoporin NUP57 [Candida tropicalis]